MTTFLWYTVVILTTRSLYGIYLITDRDRQLGRPTRTQHYSLTDDFWRFVTNVGWGVWAGVLLFGQ